MSPRQIVDPVFKPGRGLVGNASPRLRFVRDSKAKDRTLPRPGDGSCWALLDPLAGVFAADVDMTVVSVAHEAVVTTLKFAIQFIQHEIREQPPLRGAFPAGLKQPVVQHTGRQIASDKPKHPPVLDARRHSGHEFVVIDSVEKFRQVDIDNKLIAFSDIGLRLRHCLLGAAARPEAVAVLAERRVQQQLKPL